MRDVDDPHQEVEMNLRGTIAAAIDDLDLQRSAAAQIIGATATDWRNRLIQPRRELSRSLGEIAALIGEAESKALVPQAESHRARGGLSRFRRKAALHQTSYPACIIDTDTGEYRRSAQAVQSGHATFVKLIRDIYGLPARGG
jgi:hypothetical protein